MATETARQEEIRRLGVAADSATLDSSVGMENVTAQILIDCLKTGVLVDPALFFEEEINVNWPDVETGGTLCHIAAAYGIRPVIRLLIADPETDYLAKDRKGRYPSELAYEVAQDYAVGRLLIKKEAEQVARTGVRAYGPDAGKIIIENDDAGA